MQYRTSRPVVAPLWSSWRRGRFPASKHSIQREGIMNDDRRPFFAANWKMHLGPEATAEFVERFSGLYLSLIHI